MSCRSYNFGKNFVKVTNSTANAVEVITSTMSFAEVILDHLINVKNQEINLIYAALYLRVWTWGGQRSTK
jgi:hypothetical protein